MSSFSKDSSAIKGSLMYLGKTRRAFDWKTKFHSTGGVLSFQDMDQVFNESLKVIGFLDDLKSTIPNPEDDISQKILGIDIECDLVELKKLKESKSNHDVNRIFARLRSKIDEFYDLTLALEKLENTTSKEQEFKGKWKSELDNLDI